MPSADSGRESHFATLVGARAAETGRPVIGVRPVTDTVKKVNPDGFVLRTIDREALRTPLVVSFPGEQPEHAEWPGRSARDFRVRLTHAVSVPHELMERSPDD